MERMERIGNPLRDLLQRLRLTEPLTGWRAVELWPSVVGERVAARTQALSFREGVVFVEVESAAWMNELTYLKRRLIRDLNEKLGEDLVRDIRWVLRSRSPARAKDPRGDGQSNDAGTRR
jgi:predicted nucleic acid-binding Zn ribbon protein